WPRSLRPPQSVAGRRQRLPLRSQGSFPSAIPLLLDSASQNKAAPPSPSATLHHCYRETSCNHANSPDGSILRTNPSARSAANFPKELKSSGLPARRALIRRRLTDSLFPIPNRQVLARES